MNINLGHLNSKYVRGWSKPLQCASQRLVNRIVRRSSGSRNGRITIGHMTNEQKATLLFKIKMAPGSWMQVRLKRGVLSLFEQSVRVLQRTINSIK